LRLLTPAFPLFAFTGLLFGGLHQTVIMFRVLKEILRRNTVAR